MVRNIAGGNKTKKLKRNFGKYNALEKIEPGQMFAKIIHNNGGSFSVLCSDGITRLGKLSGEMKKGPRLAVGSYVVISLREFESDQKHCDIIAHGDPPSDVINILKNDQKSTSKNGLSQQNDVDFVDSDDEFKDFEESTRTIKKVGTSNKNNSENKDVKDTKDAKDNKDSKDTKDNYNWDDI